MAGRVAEEARLLRAYKGARKRNEKLRALRSLELFYKKTGQQVKLKGIKAKIKKLQKK